MLIATEGNNKTEELYFRNFRSLQRKYNIHLVPGNATDPFGMASSIKRAAAKIDFGTEEDDITFCVLDIDANPDKAEAARRITENPPVDSFHLIVSNPCFELWFLCHFDDGKSTAFLDSKEALRKMTKVVPGYQKNKSIFPQLYEHTERAIANARNLLAHQSEQGRQSPSHDANPLTEVFMIIEKLIGGNSLDDTTS